MAWGEPNYVAGEWKERAEAARRDFEAAERDCHMLRDRVHDLEEQITELELLSNERLARAEAAEQGVVRSSGKLAECERKLARVREWAEDVRHMAINGVLCEPHHPCNLCKPIWDRYDELFPDAILDGEDVVHNETGAAGRGLNILDGEDK